VEKFKNKLHSAAWDDTVDLNDKVVGIIGNGSSAVQIIPAIFSSKLIVSRTTPFKEIELIISQQK
jgi:cation diffusion facilitator CzcD-associated flavoprotein CzcO